MKTNFKFRDDAGVLHEGSVAVTDYAAAADEGLSLTQFMSRKFPTDEAKYGSVLSQALTSNGLHVKGNQKLGIKSSSMKDVLNGVKIAAGAIVSPDQMLTGKVAGVSVISDGHGFINSLSKFLLEMG